MKFNKNKTKFQTSQMKPIINNKQKNLYQSCIINLKRFNKMFLTLNLSKLILKLHLWPTANWWNRIHQMISQFSHGTWLEQYQEEFKTSSLQLMLSSLIETSIETFVLMMILEQACAALITLDFSLQMKQQNKIWTNTRRILKSKKMRLIRKHHIFISNHLMRISMLKTGIIKCKIMNQLRL